MKVVTKTAEQAKREREERKKQRDDDTTCPECGRVQCRLYQTVIISLRLWDEYKCKCGCEWRTECRE